MKFKFLTSLLAIAAFASLPLATFAQDSTISTRQIYAYAGVPASGTSEVDTLTIQSGTSALVFTLTVAGGRTTAPITWSATDATLIARIDAAVEALSAVGVGGVTTAAGTGTSGIGTYTLTFTGKNAKTDMPALTLTEVSRTGGTAATISTTTAGVAATWASAPTGTVIVNTSTGTLYSNTSTTANSPTWTAIVGLAVTTSADLRGVLSDETGTGVAVFATTPTLVTPVIGVATGTSLAVTAGLTSSGPTGAGIGYATGAGGAVTQATNRSTGVTLSKLTGQITTDTTSLAAAAFADFVVTNTTVAATDAIVASIVPGGTGSPRVNVVNVASGSFTLRITNDHAATADTSADKVNFAVIKAVAN